MGAALAIDDEDRYGEVLVDRPATTGHPDLWVGTCLGCGGRVTRRLSALDATRLKGWTSACAPCRRELRRGITARNLSTREKSLLLRWEIYGTLYSAEDIAAETEAIRVAVGRECGGWQSGRMRVAPHVDPPEDVNEPKDRTALREEMTLDEVGREFGLSRERISQIERGALRKLQRRSVSWMLRPSMTALMTMASEPSYEDALIAMLDCVVPPSDAEVNPVTSTATDINAAIARANAAPDEDEMPNAAYGILRGLGFHGASE